MRKYEKLLYILLAAAFLTGCPKTEVNKNNRNRPEKTEPPVLETVLNKKKYKTEYLISNGVKLQSTQININENNKQCQVILPQIAGITDNELNKKINKSIISDIETDVKSYLDDPDNDPRYSYFYILMNVNDLLTVRADYGYNVDVFGALYDLRDGKRLSLKDIFTQGTDYVSLLNEKVIEKLLSGRENEEELLKKPFSTIKADQEFLLTDSTLSIVFHRGESGFARPYFIEIPLSEIDDYVDIFDRYSTGNFQKYNYTQLMAKKNNIFELQRRETIQRKDGKILITYPELSGFKDAAYGKIINDKIKESINEVITAENLQNLSSDEPNTSDIQVGNISIYLSYNYYGILSISRYVYIMDKPSSSDYNKTYAFDLINKKEVYMKDILSNEILPDQKSRDTFVRKLIDNMIISNETGENYTELYRQKLLSTLTYDTVAEKATIEFVQDYSTDSKGMLVRTMFKENSIEGIPCPIYSYIYINDAFPAGLQALGGRWVR